MVCHLACLRLCDAGDNTTNRIAGRRPFRDLRYTARSDHGGEAARTPVSSTIIPASSAHSDIVLGQWRLSLTHIHLHPSQVSSIMHSLPWTRFLPTPKASCAERRKASRSMQAPFRLGCLISITYSWSACRRAAQHTSSTAYLAPFRPLVSQSRDVVRALRVHGSL